MHVLVRKAGVLARLPDVLLWTWRAAQQSKPAAAA
jgi:hypothetical protein